MRPSAPRWLNAVLTSAALIAAVTAVIALLEPDVPALGLGVLYLLAVVPIALVYGAAPAGAVSLVSMLAFNFFFLTPRHTLNPGATENRELLLAFLVSSLVVGFLAARSQREARRSARLADEQAALRRVATQVAHGVAPAEVFAVVAREVGQLLDVSATHMGRYDADGAVTAVSSWSRDGAHVPVGARSTFDATSVAGVVFTTARPARKDHYTDASGEIAAVAHELGIRSSVAAPVVVDGHVWGVMIASSNEHQPFGADTEPRIAAFTELVATAISNTEARAKVRRLADEQAALRRVATLVVEGWPAAEIFSAVATELERLFDAQATLLGRLEPDQTITIVANNGTAPEELAVGTRLELESGMVLARVVRTGRAARVDDYSRAPEFIEEMTQRVGIRCSVAVPIIVDGSLWGSLGAATDREQFPADAEERMTAFTDLIATALANAQSRADLAASRARVVATADETRRRIERDLHDGAQQTLVHSVIALKLAQRALGDASGPAVELVAEALDHAERAITELRELAHGILPATLSRGLAAAVETLVSRVRLPVSVDVTEKRLVAELEATAYFVVSEALTNTVKHARASRARVTASVADGALHVEVSDDGVGGAHTGGKSGLLGLYDRVAAMDGELRVDSPAGAGTTVAATIPLLES